MRRIGHAPPFSAAPLTSRLQRTRARLGSVSVCTLPRSGRRYGPAEPATRVASTRADKTARGWRALTCREPVIHAPSDRSHSSRATVYGGSDGATVATLAVALGRVPTNQKRRPRAGVKTRARRGATRKKRTSTTAQAGFRGRREPADAR